MIYLYNSRLSIWRFGMITGQKTCVIDSPQYFSKVIFTCLESWLVYNMSQCVFPPSCLVVEMSTQKQDIKPNHVIDLLYLSIRNNTVSSVVK